MVSLVLAIQVEAPAGIEVARHLERTQLQNGFRSGDRPAGASAIEAIADEVTASPLDNPAGDGESLGQRAAICLSGRTRRIEESSPITSSVVRTYAT